MSQTFNEVGEMFERVVDLLENGGVFAQFSLSVFC